MGIPNANVKVKNGGLGAAFPSGTDVLAVAGTCSSGTVAQPLLVAGDEIGGNFGSGPAVDFANYCFQVTKKPILLTRVATNTQGAIGAVDVTGVTGTSVITATGTPVDSFDLVFKAVKGGAIGTVGITFQVSLDGGKTWLATKSLGTANSYLIPGTGVTLNFAVGTLIAGDTAKLSTTEPLWDDAGVGDGMTALQDTPFLYRCIHLVGEGDTNVFANVQTALDQMADPNYRYTHAFASARRATGIESDAQWVVALTGEYDGFVAERMAIGAGHARYVSKTYSNAKLRRPITWGAVALYMSQDVQISISKVKVDGAVRPIPGCSILSDTGVLEEHDERVSPGLTDARFIAARTFLRESGVFVALPNIMCAPGSDFSRVHLRAVMDVFCDTVQRTTQRELSDEVRLNKATGFLDEAQAKLLEGEVTKELNKALLETGRASAVTYSFARNDPLATPGTKLHGAGEVTPLGYIEGIESTLAFTNPAIAALQGG